MLWLGFGGFVFLAKEALARERMERGYCYAARRVRDELGEGSCWNGIWGEMCGSYVGIGERSWAAGGDPSRN